MQNIVIKMTENHIGGSVTSALHKCNETTYMLFVRRRYSRRLISAIAAESVRMHEYDRQIYYVQRAICLDSSFLLNEMT